MTDDTDEHRYLFTVRQRFNEMPKCDSFYELQVPAGLTSEQAQIFKRLNENFCRDEISADTTALNGMSMRVRFNPDMYQRVCLVRTTAEITAEDMDVIIEEKHREDALTTFLDESAIDV